MAGEAPQVVLVETSAALPGLLPFQAWDALALAETVYVRDVDAHPAARHLWFAGVELTELAPASLDPKELDLSTPGSPADRRLTKALLTAAEEHDRVVYLLGPEDDGLARVVGMESTDHPADVEFVFFAPAPRGTEVLGLVDVMTQLRDPEEGCPWDLEQDHESLTRYLLEEAYELIEAIERRHDLEIQEELGDVLLQVVFHAQIARDRGSFGIDDVARGITEKLVRRHPHVFADGEASDAAEVEANWNELKQEEKARESPLEGIPVSLPALMRAQKIQRRAARTGFDWGAVEGPAEKVREELAEVLAADTEADRHQEIGDLLLAVVALARHLGIDAEEAARAAGTRFTERFERVLEMVGRADRDRDTMNGEAWVQLWREAAGGLPDRHE